MVYVTYRNASAADPEGARDEAGPGGGAPPAGAGECRRGRPRSERVRAAILAAANRLLEAGSVRELTVEAVAHVAGVGKPTVYRRWPTKAALVMDAFLAATPPPPVMFREGGSAAEMLRGFCQGSRHRPWPTRAGLAISPALTAGGRECGASGAGRRR
jgi:hypothetical protein